MPADDPEPTLIPHATCLACGCLCDDIRVTVDRGRVVGADRACAVGLPWFLADHPGEGHPAVLVEGRAVSLDEALDRASAILSQARSPVVWGLTRSSVEAVAVGLALADRIGAMVDLDGSVGRADHRAAFVRVGEVSATLGEVKDRAEVVLFWGGHPDATHPRHAERYSVQPPGRFLAGDRTVIVVDVGPAHPPSGTADVRVPLAPDLQGEALRVLLALSHGVALDPARVERATGQPLAVWADLIRRFGAARYAAICFGPATGSLGVTGWDAALTLVIALNRDGRRCVGLPLGEPGNVAGAEAVLTWQAGAPSHLDFGSAAPRHLPLEASLADRLKSGEADAVLAVGADPLASLPPDALARLGVIPWIHVSPGACRESVPIPSVAIDVGRLGIEAGGTVGRVDGVMLPLRPPLLGPRPTDGAILAAILDRLGGPETLSPARSAATSSGPL